MICDCKNTKICPQCQGKKICRNCGGSGSTYYDVKHLIAILLGIYDNETL